MRGTRRQKAEGAAHDRSQGPPVRRRRRAGPRPGGAEVRPALGQLDARGLLNRAAHPSDSRASSLNLTPAGRAVFEDIAADFAAGDARMLAALDPDEQRLFSQLLGRLSEASARWG